MTATLTVGLNHESLHDISVADTFETAGSFTVELDNRGEAVHVHLHLDDDLSRVARLETGNHFVEREATRPVSVEVRPVDEPVSGKLKVVTGYGAETVYVDVTVTPDQPKKDPVVVDETLSKPPQEEPSSPGLASSVASALVRGDRAAVASVLVLAVVAVAVAVGVALTVQSAAVYLGVGVVIGVALAGVVFVLR